MLEDRQKKLLLWIAANDCESHDGVYVEHAYKGMIAALGKCPGLEQRWRKKYCLANSSVCTNCKFAKQRKGLPPITQQLNAHSANETLTQLLIFFTKRVPVLNVVSRLCAHHHHTSLSLRITGASMGRQAERVPRLINSRRAVRLWRRSSRRRI